MIETTDVNAVATAKLPDNLTTFRVMAVAVSRLTAVARPE